MKGVFFFYFSKNIRWVFVPVPIKKRSYWTYWTNLSLMYCFIEIQITMSFYCSWMGPFNFFRFMFVLLREKIRPNSICTYRANDLSTTFFCYDFFLNLFHFMSSPNYSMYSSYYSIGWQFEIAPIVSIRIVYDISGNRTYIINLLPIWYFLNGAWRLYFISPGQP